MTFWIVTIAAGLAALVLLEAGCRWWIRSRSRYYVWPPRTRLELQLDREVFPDLDPRARFDINADGERGATAPRDDEPGLFRILAAGGSAVECYALDQSKTWTGVLERMLNEPDRLSVLGARRVHVGNVGHSGVGSAELDRILECLLPQYRRLDAILIMVAASDVYHWLEEGAPASPPSSVPEDMLFACHPAHRFGWKPSTWAMIEIARRVRRAWSGQVQVKEHAGSWFAAARRMRAEAREVRTAMPDPTVMLDNFEHYFTRLVRRAQAHADRVIILRQPWFEKDYTAEERARFWHGGAGKPWKEKVTTYFGLEVVNRLLSLVEARVVTVADALGVPHVELHPVLNGGLRHYYDHDHYTAAGAAVVASTVAAALTRRVPAPHTPRPGVSTQPAMPSMSGRW